MLVNVCVPVNVATVASMSIVTSWLETVDVKPVPPVIVNVWELNMTFPEPLSPLKFIFEPAFSEST